MQDNDNKASAPLNGLLQAHLGDKLRRLFSETAAQPIPDRFADLLNQLDRDMPRPAIPSAGARAWETI